MALTLPDAVNPLYGSTIYFPREGRLTCFTSSYLLNASNGDRRDAFQAGYTPAAKLKKGAATRPKRSFGSKMGTNEQILLGHRMKEQKFV
jgi:hypothetical protein